MMLRALLESGLTSEGPPRLTATDIASWLRLGQCDRFLRFHLEYRNERKVDGAGFMDELDVAPQPLPTLRSGSGAQFEADVLRQIAPRYRLIDCAGPRQSVSDNRRVIELIRSRETVAVTQPRLHVELAGWSLRGDLDVLLIEPNGDDDLELTVFDMKSSADSRIEHKIQVALYMVMLEELGRTAEIRIGNIAGGIIYRGSNDPERLSNEAARKYRDAQAAAEDLGLAGALLDHIDDPVLYLDTIDDLILDQQAVVRRIAGTGLLETSHQYAPSCDGCFFNEACLKIASDRDDLSMIPFMSIDAQRAIRRSGITTTEELATLKEPGRLAIAGVERQALVPASGWESLCHDLGDDRAIAGRLDEFIARARKQHDLPGTRKESGNNLIGAGYGSLPYSAPDHDPNLVRIFIDIQRDYLHDRIYLASALIQANEAGVLAPDRCRMIVKLAERAPDSADVERSLLIDFIRDVLVTLDETAAPDEEGNANAPLHLIFYERGVMTALLQALGRNADEVLGATALYDFVAQLPAFDSPLVTMLAEEIRTLKNYPLLAPSLQAVSRYLGFDWDEERPLTERFRRGHFDDVRPVDEAADTWFTGRARFSSAIPLEYAYATWNEPETSIDDEPDAWPIVSRDDLLALAGRRLEAMAKIASDFRGNDRSYKARFSLPDLALFEERPASVATGIEEFILTERHVELGAWRQARLQSPEQRMLNGVSLVVRYLEDDQDPGIAEENRENARRQQLRQDLYDAWAAEEHDEGEKFTPSKEEREAIRWSNDGRRYHFEIVHPGGSERIEHLLGLSEIKVDSRVLIGDRWSVDGRLPVEEQVEFQTTVRQLLYGKRADVVGIRTFDTPEGIRRTLITLQFANSYRGEEGFVFFAWGRTLTDGALYTVESDPNNIMFSRGKQLALRMQEGLVNSIAERLEGERLQVSWNVEAAEGQRRFLDGIDAFTAAGHIHPFEPQKRRFIGELGDAGTVLVQGPPGTGKSYTTAYAIWARIQGARAGGLPYRVVISCKTHAATDVLIRNLAEVQHDLRRLHRVFTEMFEAHFDPGILDVPIVRFKGSTPMQGVTLLHERGHASMNGERAMRTILGHDQIIAGMTPGGAWSLMGETKDRFQARFSNLLVLDEASQMSLPEAMMAGISLELDGQKIVVGDHRQMPPIIQHDWANEARRSFKRFAAYESLYLALDRVAIPEHKIKFAESFRLHRDMAEFLRREIYRHDDIPYFSRKTACLALDPGSDFFVNAVLGPEPMVLVVHDEASSQTSNTFEQALIARITSQLGHFDPINGMGVVVPHRAQRSQLQETIEALTIRASDGSIERSSVDTVERFQGDERRVVLVSLTESDPQFIRLTGEFLLDPRRLTVALSRAKEKLIIIASRSVFTVVSSDEETFVNAGLWKNLLRRTCIETAWSGEIEGHALEVRVNRPLIGEHDRSTV